MTTSYPEDRTGARIAAAAAVLFGACFFVTVASVNVPHHGTDAEVLAWWQQDSSLTEGMVSMTFAIATAVLFSAVTGYVLLRAGDRCAPLVAFARSMATAFTVTLLVSGALRGVIGHLVNVEERPLPGLDVLDYSTALNYTVLSVVVMTCFALSILAIGGLVVRTGILARWHGIGRASSSALWCSARSSRCTAPSPCPWRSLVLCTAVAVVRATPNTTHGSSTDHKLDSALSQA